MGYGLRREIEMLMKILGRDPWYLALSKITDSKFRYRLVDCSQFARSIVVDGEGPSKKAALENLLETWRSGKSVIECPARSREELELKLELLGLNKKNKKRRRRRKKKKA